MNSSWPPEVYGQRHSLTHLAELVISGQAHTRLVAGVQADACTGEIVDAPGARGVDRHAGQFARSEFLRTQMRKSAAAHR
ncbi:MAG: hypothetical protein DLM58_16135 [Pseudonocardiales bacterium]|nr:MAG: hypothetical protein DLM58_16135 [Pseudonocardiales bacterium]